MGTLTSSLARLDDFKGGAFFFECDAEPKIISSSTKKGDMTFTESHPVKKKKKHVCLNESPQLRLKFFT